MLGTWEIGDVVSLVGILISLLTVLQGATFCFVINITSQIATLKAENKAYREEQKDTKKELARVRDGLQEMRLNCVRHHKTTCAEATG